MNAPPPYGQQQPQAPYPPQAPYHAPAPPPQKKGMSGCLLAGLIVGGLFLMAGLGVVIFVWRFASSEAGKKIVSAVSSGAQLAAEAQNAPGTELELRALGCTQAMVLDTAKIAALAAQFGDAGVHTGSGAGLLVSCQVPRASGAPTCDAVAAAYVKAVGTASAEFEVNVALQGSGKEQCGAVYQPDGAKVRR